MDCIETPVQKQTVLGLQESDMTDVTLTFTQRKGVSQVILKVKNPLASAGDEETWVQFLGWEYPLEESTATHSSILAWRILWTEEHGGLQSMGSQRVRHN